MSFVEDIKDWSYHESREHTREWIPTRLRAVLREYALPAIGLIVLGGLFSVAMDADHIVPSLARTTHPIVVIVMCLVSISSIAYLAGFNDRHMLRIIERKEKVKECVKIEIH